MVKTREYEAKATDGSGRVIKFIGPVDATEEQLQTMAERLSNQTATPAPGRVVPQEVQGQRDQERLKILQAEREKLLPRVQAGDPRSLGDLQSLEQEIARVSQTTVTSGPAQQAASVSAQPSQEPPKPPSSGGLGGDSLERQLDEMQKEQDVRMGQIIGGGAGLALGASKAGLDIGRAAMQGIGRNIAQGAATAQAPQGGTSGEKWARNWAGQERPGIGGVPQASAAYQRSKGQGKISERLSKMYGPAGPNEPKALVDRLIARGTPPSGLERVSALFQSMIGPASLGARYALPPLALAAAGGEGIRAKQMYEEGDTTGAALAGLSALGAVGSLTPLAPIAAPIGMGAGALQYLRSRLEPNEHVTPQELVEASRPSFRMSRP